MLQYDFTKSLKELSLLFHTVQCRLSHTHTHTHTHLLLSVPLLCSQGVSWLAGSSLGVPGSLSPCPEGPLDDPAMNSDVPEQDLMGRSKNGLQIQVYYDDSETSNPLGSKQGIHKLGCLYFTLRNLPPRLNSCLMNIHLISLFHSQDAKKYGLDQMLSPFVEDVKVLEQKGMKVSFTEQPLYGTISQVTGDNLGLNSILGFVESFSANY